MEIYFLQSRTLTRMEPETLLSRAYQLEPQALAEIHDTYFPVIYRYLRYRLDDPNLVEDLTSDVFIDLLDHLHQHHSHINNLKSWLLGVANHLMNDHLRLKYRHLEVDIEDHENLPDDQFPDQQVEQRQTQVEVQQAMFQLTTDQQNVLALRFSQEMSLEETAQMMGKKINAVKVLQFRAISSLRRLLEKRGRQ